MVCRLSYIFFKKLGMKSIKKVRANVLPRRIYEGIVKLSRREKGGRRRGRNRGGGWRQRGGDRSFQ